MKPRKPKRRTGIVTQIFPIYPLGARGVDPTNVTGDFQILIESRRLRTLFDDVWTTIPDLDRKALAKKIDIATDHLTFASRENRKRRKGLAFTTWGVYGYILVFFARRLFRYDDDFIRGTIAHEFAHAILDHPAEWLDPKFKDTDPGTHESEADQVTQLWGFPAMNFELNQKTILKAYIKGTQ